MKKQTTRIDEQDFNVQSLEDEEYEVITKVARDVPVSRERAQYTDVEKVTSYDTPFQATATVEQKVLRQKRIAHAHSDRAGHGHGPELHHQKVVVLSTTSYSSSAHSNHGAYTKGY